MNTARHLGDEIVLRPGGAIERRAEDVLTACEALLQRVAAMGLMNAIESAAFADVSRAPEGGRGFEGVFARADDYWNPFEEALRPSSFDSAQDDKRRTTSASVSA